MDLFLGTPYSNTPKTMDLFLGTRFELHYCATRFRASLPYRKTSGLSEHAPRWDRRRGPDRQWNTSHRFV